MSHQQARHRKPTRREAARYARHRRPSPVATALRRGPAVTALVAGTTLAAGTGAAFAVSSLTAPGPAANAGHPAAEGLELTQPGGTQPGRPAGTATTSPTPPPAHSTPARKAAARSRHAAVARRSQPPPVYRNPLRAIAGLIPERADMGVDFGGNGPVYALGDAVITNATGSSTGWPGGGWITYQLTAGPAKGLQVFLAEDVRPTVQVGEHVTADTVIAQMSNQGDGIETGWAWPNGASAESQLPEAGGVSGGGPFPTNVGLNFDRLLMALGVPAAPNYAASGYGVLPAGYPRSWASVQS